MIAQDNDTGRLFLREVPPGLAAARGDLKVGDEILLIDGVDVRFMDAKAINAALVGEVDSTVKLTLIRGRASAARDAQANRGAEAARPS